MEYRTLKLCSVKNAAGVPCITPPGAVVEIADKDEVARLEALECIALVDAEPAKADEGGAGIGDLDGDAFAAWVASGAKVGQVIDWIGDDVARAEVAMADGRKGVQKHIEGMLEADG